MAEAAGRAKGVKQARGFACPLNARRGSVLPSATGRNSNHDVKQGYARCSMWGLSAGLATKTSHQARPAMLETATCGCRREYIPSGHVSAGHGKGRRACAEQPCCWLVRSRQCCAVQRLMPGCTEVTQHEQPQGSKQLAPQERSCQLHVSGARQHLRASPTACPRAWLQLQ